MSKMAEIPARDGASFSALQRRVTNFISWASWSSWATAQLQLSFFGRTQAQLSWEFFSPAQLRKFATLLQHLPSAWRTDSSDCTTVRQGAFYAVITNLIWRDQNLTSRYRYASRITNYLLCCYVNTKLKMLSSQVCYLWTCREFDSSARLWHVRKFGRSV